MLPMAIPGMVLGLAYIFFFNDPRNPLNAIYGTLAILVVCMVTHFYTVSHLTAMTALKQMDREFESVAASLKQPFYRLDRKSTRLNPVTNAHLVCRLLPEHKKQTQS